MDEDELKTCDSSEISNNLILKVFILIVVIKFINVYFFTYYDFHTHKAENM